MKRLAATVAVSSVLVVPASAKAHHGKRCHTRSCHERVAAKQCSQTRVLPCIRRAAIRWRVSYRMLKRKAWCESRFDPYAKNGPHAGLFQFRVAAPSTWATTPYRNRNPWRAKWNALAAGWMHHVGRGSEWACR